VVPVGTLQSDPAGSSAVAITGYADEPDRPFVYPGGSITRPNRMDGHWWVWPLPPPGRLDFICRLGEAGTWLSVEARLILDTSHRSTRAWPRP
jgi:hypothetical protein